MTKVCLDLETTGLDIGGARPGICQIAAKKFDNYDTSQIAAPYLEEEFETLVNPELPPSEFWHPKAIEATGIGPEQVKDAPTFFEVLPQLAQFVCGCDTWVGYNSEFDVRILAMNLERYGFTTHFPWPLHRIDVMPMAKAAMNVDKGYKLTDAYHFVTGKELDNAHDASVDVQATITVLKGLENNG